MPNSIIELHDSRMTRIRSEGSAVVLELNAYIHVSDGIPGVDAGTGWRQPIRMTIEGAVVRKDFEGEGLWITDGTIRVWPELARESDASGLRRDRKSRN